MISLEFQRSASRFLAARAVAGRATGLVAQVAPLRLGHRPDPRPPASGWSRVRPLLSGICGSDLAMLAGKSSFYFSPVVSTPFVPGHEVVGIVEDGQMTGRRVVVEPVLACVARGVNPPCTSCASGDTGLCHRTAHGHLAPGLQTGYCADTSGGWSTALVAHESQLRPIPDALDDETAVLVEPLACAIHAALRAGVRPDDTVLVAGAGTIGLLVIAALRALTPAGRILALAKHRRQRAEAQRLGADQVIAPDAAARGVRLATGSLMLSPERGGDWLAGGVDVSLECSGRLDALDVCLRTTRPRGRVVLAGLPAPGRLDLAPVWHRELEVAGAYTYGTERVEGREARTFDLALELAGRLELGRLVSAAYPLRRWREAVDHAMDAGRLDAIKVVFRP